MVWDWAPALSRLRSFYMQQINNGIPVLHLSCLLPGWVRIARSTASPLRPKMKKFELSLLNKTLFFLAASIDAFFFQRIFWIWVHGAVGVVMIQLEIYRIWFVRATVRGFFRYSFKGTSTQQNMDWLAANAVKINDFLVSTDSVFWWKSLRWLFLNVVTSWLAEVLLEVFSWSSCGRIRR